MEHRWSARKAVSRNVTLDSPRVGPVHATLRDISLGGALVETGPVTIPLNAPVVLAFTLSHSDDLDYYRLHAMVVRQAPAGAGLMFLELDTATVRALRDVLYGAPLAVPPAGDGVGSPRYADFGGRVPGP